MAIFKSKNNIQFDKKDDEEFFRSNVRPRIKVIKTHNPSNNADKNNKEKEQIPIFSNGYFDDKYRTTINIIGKGKYNYVTLAYNKDEEPLALKILKIEDRCEEYCYREINILKSIEHPNIIKIVDVFRDEVKQKIYLFTNYYSGGEVFNDLLDKKKYTEDKTKFYLKQLVNTIDYLHNTVKICHKDLKLENLVFADVNKDKIILIDFGLSERISNNDFNQGSGTYYYMAPEIFNSERYNYKVDIWSIGIIMYVMLCGQFPFTGSDNNIIRDKVVNYDYNLGKMSNQISEPAKNLLKLLLTKRPVNRIDISTTIDNIWFNDI